MNFQLNKMFVLLHNAASAINRVVEDISNKVIIKKV